MVINNRYTIGQRLYSSLDSSIVISIDEIRIRSDKFYYSILSTYPGLNRVVRHTISEDQIREDLFGGPTIDYSFPISNRRIRWRSPTMAG